MLAQIMLPTFFESCNDTVRKWEKMLSSDGSCEVDVWPFLQNLTSDVISRTAFGSNFEEGTRIFELLREQAKLAMEVLLKAFIPGWRYEYPVNLISRITKLCSNFILETTNFQIISRIEITRYFCF